MKHSQHQTDTETHASRAAYLLAVTATHSGAKSDAVIQGRSVMIRSELAVSAMLAYADERIFEAAADQAKALMPFAAVAAADVSENEDDADIYRPLTHSHAPHITIGDLRRALAAIGKACAA